MLKERTILLVDMDAFFASIEVAQRPHLRGKPVIVIGGGAERSAVNAATYEAKSRGIRGGMPVSQAKRICPDGVFIQADLDKYVYVSGRLIELFEKYSPLVEPYSIDEAFIDITGTGRLLGRPTEIARRLKREVRETCGLIASVGIAPNKSWAKIACSLGKPDGLIVLSRENITKLAETLPVESLSGVGKKTKDALDRLGIKTVAQLAGYPKDALERLFGICGPVLHQLARGIDESPVIPWQKLPRPKSVGHEFTLPQDVSDTGELVGVLAWLTETVVHRLRMMNAAARTVQLKLRLANFHTFVRRNTVGHISTELDAFEPLRSLMLNNLPVGASVRQIGVVLTGIVYSDSDLPIIGGLLGDLKREKAARVVEKLQQRWGSGAIRWGRSAKWLLSKGDSLEVFEGPQMALTSMFNS